MKNILKAIAISVVLAGCGAQAPNTEVSEAQPIENNATQASVYDTVNPPISEHMKSPSILVFSKTREWRHEDGIAGANLHMIKLARKLGYGTFSTENGAVFNDENLARFKLVVMNNFTGDGLSPTQEKALQDWVEAGGGLLALHGSGDASHSDWPWYADNVIGPTFIGHPAAPQFQDARIENLAPEHPVMAGIPAEWTANDEWYSFDSLPMADFTLLAGLDESTYSPVNTKYGDVSDLRMGEGAQNHPIIWSRCLGEGRTVFSAIGHRETAYDSVIYQKLLENAANWVAKTTDAEGAGC